MSAAQLAICAIIGIALSVWMFQVGRDPRQWRMRWLDLFGILDSDTPREQRLAQEAHVRFMSMVLFLLLVAMSVSCGYWSAWQLREGLKPRSSVERELELLREQAESFRRR